ncbi:hypothetical protein JVT61DRAFT_6311 [Boletus reticuloceps]|uniref:Uncharacterized protein n=1 Tax=Boletus reticuloceps TaxID=495285 RepID=A0A8I2YM12_9AGAM|nr:hypothetical protein JVT61DRAFT_6311 [Boletus reticuloceps]
MASQFANPKDEIVLCEELNQFTLAKIKAVYSTPFAQGFSSELCQVAIRAVLRHGAHQDRTHYHMKTQGGLHPVYIAFNPPDKSNHKVLEASVSDVFDAITVQDRLDGGISLLIRCMGYEIPSNMNMSADKVNVDVYITPRELVRNEHVNGDTAMLVQAFCQDFALPHLEPFTHPVSLKGPNHLPGFASPMLSCVQCTGLSQRVFKEPIASDNTSNGPSPSSAISEAISLIPHANTPPPCTPSGQHSIRKHRLADAFLASAGEKNLELPLVVPSDTLALGPPLISLGPSTDAILDQFGLEDHLLPRLHVLTRMVCSSRWEAVLRTAPWKMTNKQATHLACTLAEDLKVTPGVNVKAIIGLVRCAGCSTHPPIPLPSMVTQVHLLSKSGTRRVQPPPPQRLEVTMSAEARTALRTEQHCKAEKFQSDLSAAFRTVDEMVHTLAANHHKSVHRVQTNLYFGHVKFCTRRKPNPWNAFLPQQGRKRRRLKALGLADNSMYIFLLLYCIGETVSNAAPGGKATLPSMVKENLPQYQALDDANKKQLVEDFSDFRVTKAVGTRISMQSKLNDITHTLTAVGTELDNLKAQTGVEAILYATRGTTDLPMKGSAYASEGVEDFMGSVMGLDTPEIISKMEGFVVQGVKGEITVTIKGWLDTIPFANLSTACSGITQLEILLCRWETGKTQWKVLSPKELEELRQERNEQLEEIKGQTC